MSIQIYVSWQTPCSQTSDCFPHTFCSKYLAMATHIAVFETRIQKTWGFIILLLKCCLYYQGKVYLWPKTNKPQRPKLWDLRDVLMHSTTIWIVFKYKGDISKSSRKTSHTISGTKNLSSDNIHTTVRHDTIMKTPPRTAFPQSEGWTDFEKIV